MRNARDQAPIDCSHVRERARLSICDGDGALPPDAEAHLAGCGDCRAAIDRMEEVDGLLTRVLGTARRRIADPSAGEMDAILLACREEPPAAKLLRTVRRSVNRMLWLTLLILSFLLIVAVAWALIVHLRVHGG